MIHYICVDENGDLTNSGSIGGPVTPEDVMANIPGAIVVESPVPNPFNVYWDGSKVVTKPPRPSFLHKFDLASRSWGLSDETAWASARGKRSQLLAACDWTQLPDVPAGVKATWEPYRQALRDITSQSDPHNLVWPELPI